MDRLKKIVIFQKLGFFSLIIALILRVLRYRVVYLDLASKIKNEVGVQLLAVINIDQIDYNDFRYYDVCQLYSKDIYFAKKVFSKLFSDVRQLELFGQLFGSTHDKHEKLRVIVKTTIVALLNDLQETLICAEYFRKSYEKVYVFCTNNMFAEMALEEEPVNFRNINLPVFCYVDRFLYLVVCITKSCVRCIGNYICSLSKRGVRGKRTSCMIGNRRGISEYEILYFPHKGVFYGDLFLKDHYYSENPDSPFNKRNILHVEIGSGVGDRDLYAKNGAFYEENNISHCTLRKYSAKGILSSIFIFFGFVIRNYKNIISLQSYVVEKTILFLLIYISYYNYYQSLKKFKNAKLALVGYDVLFPKTLSLALSVRNIITVATQERFIQSFMNIYNVLVDYYFVQGEIVEEQFKQKDTSYVGKIVPIGPVRLDMLDKYMKSPYDKKYETIKKTYHLVVALDYHSSRNKVEGNRSPIINWENNKRFYEDLIRLAVKFPDIYIIIRGKDDVWCDVPEFSDIYEIISTIPNIEVNRDYDKVNVSYELVAMADTLIAKPTSLADEAIAAGIPVLLYDFAPNAKKVYGSLFNYESYPVFVNSYDELEKRLERIIKYDDYIDEDDFIHMRNRFYNFKNIGNIKEILHQHLMSIYCQQKKNV